MQPCVYCGKDAPQQKGKRKREYCNNVCRQLAYRKRKVATLTVTLPPVDDLDAQHMASASDLDELRAQVRDQAQTIEEQAQEITQLRTRLDVERRYLENTPYTFKSWLKQHAPSSSLTAKLHDRDALVPPKTSRAGYEAYVRRLCTEEEHQEFVLLWKTMLLSRA